MISFHCPRCKHHVTRPFTDAGQKIPCPGCSQRLLVPQPKNRPPVDDSPTMMGELTPVNVGMLVPSPPVPSPPPVPVQATLLTNPPLRCSCPHCQANINVDPQRAGSRIPCPRCKLPFEVPLAKARLTETSPPITIQPTLAQVAHEDSDEVIVQAPQRRSASSIILFIAGLSVLLVIGLCFGFGTMLLMSVSHEVQETDIARLRNQIDALDSQLKALDVECKAAADRGNLPRTALLADQIAAKCEEQATLLDTLAAKVPHGRERDDYLRWAAASRQNAQQNRLFAAEVRARS